MNRLRLRALRFRYPAQEHWALDGVTLDFGDGMVTWLTGALGSGTSTTLLALAGLAPRLTGGERQGEALLDDRDVAAMHPLGVGVAYLGPSPALQLSGIARTVHDEVAVGPMNLGWSRERITEATDEAMARLAVEHLADRAPGALSGGETQRVLLAAMLASAPAVWLLDEPFSALDHAGRGLVAAVLHDLAREGKVVVVASDDADAMAPLADRLIVFRDGGVALDGLPDALLAGDGLLETGAGTTDAATLAAAAGWPAPRPLDTEGVLARIAGVTLSDDGLGGAGAESSSPSGEPILSFAGVRFAYPGGPPVLTGVSLSLGRGEAVGLFGRNGAGKSTLLRLAMALEQPTEGVVTTLGRATSGHSPEHFAPRVGFLFQQPERQLFATSVSGECAVALQLAGWPAARITAAVEAVLEELGLVEVAAAHPYDLPLPTRRLVALASILVAGPELLLLDEPTAGLDASSRERVIDVIRARVDAGMTALVISHDASFAHEALGRAIRLEGGGVTRDGSVREMLDGSWMSRPAALAVALARQIPPGRDRRDAVARYLAAAATRPEEGG